MSCFVLVQLNSSWRQHTPVFSSPLRGTGHDPFHIVPLPLPTVLPSSHSPSPSKHKFGCKSFTCLHQLRPHSCKQIIYLCDVITNDSCIGRIRCLSPRLPLSVILLLFLTLLPLLDFEVCVCLFQCVRVCETKRFFFLFGSPVLNGRSAQDYALFLQCTHVLRHLLTSFRVTAWNIHVNVCMSVCV